jgi:hypothetical protein
MDGNQKTTDEILVDEIARLSPILGRWAVKRAARSLPTETRSETMTLTQSAEVVRERAHVALSKLGRLIIDDETGRAGQLAAVIGAGSMKLNRAVVNLRITGTNSAECSVEIEASAKEGLIKQHTAADAIIQVREALLESPL